MTLRLVAIVALLAGAGMLVAYLHLVGKGPLSSREARHLRAMKDRAATPSRVEPVVFADFTAFPDSVPLASYAPIERRGASLEGYVQRMHYATDGDYHLEFTPLARMAGMPDTVYVSCEVTPQLREGRAGWDFESLAAELRPVHRDGLAWETPPRRVRLSGWLLYDNPYAENEALPTTLRWAWKRFGLGLHLALGEEIPLWNRMSWWEIHPVTRIEVWDEARGAWRDVGGALAAGAGS